MISVLYQLSWIATFALPTAVVVWFALNPYRFMRATLAIYLLQWRIWRVQPDVDKLPPVLQYVYQNETEETYKGSPIALSAWMRRRKGLSLLLWVTAALGAALTALIGVGVIGMLAI